MTAIATLLLAMAFAALIDRSIPFHVRMYAGRAFRSSSKEYWQRYGLVSFPRTLHGAAFCASTLLDYVTPVAHAEVGYIAAGLVMIFAASAGIDAFRAGR